MHVYAHYYSELLIPLPTIIPHAYTCSFSGDWIPAVKVLLLISIGLAMFSMISAFTAYMKDSYKWVRWTIAILVLQGMLTTYLSILF